MRAHHLIRVIAVLVLVFQIAGCGGGGSGTTTSVGSTTLQGQFVDAPTNGLSYAASPSGLSGTTSGGGYYSYKAGDTVTFTLSTGGSTSIDIGIKTQSTQAVGAVTFVTSLEYGQQVAEILQALNHGTGSTMDVSGLTIPPAVVAAINSYISSGGANLAGFASDDQFLEYVQTNTTAPTPLTVKVTGSGNTFLESTVLPNLQASALAISTSGGGSSGSGGTIHKFSGSILNSGSLVIPAQNGCTSVTVTSSGGGILNATVNGDVQTPGTYIAQVSSGSFLETATSSTSTCTAGNSTVIVPGTSSSATVPPFSGSVTIVSDGTHLTVSGPLIGSPPAGCSGGNTATGTVIGLSNPMVTLASTMTCTINGATFSDTMTVKMVGSF